MTGAGRTRTRAPWTTSAELRAQVERLWARGQLGQAVISAAVGDAPADPALPAGAADGRDGEGEERDDDHVEAMGFPLRLRLRRPTSRELTDRFDEVRRWIDDLSTVSAIRIERRRVNHRVLGANEVPAEAWVDSLDDALALAGLGSAAADLRRMAVVTQRRRQAAVALLRRRPVAMLAHFEVWERLLDLVDWIEAHPAPAVYLRQVDLPGVDTKLIEAHRAVLVELIDQAAPSAIVDGEASGVRGFERRYGFRSKPNLVRFRVLDPDRQPPGLRGATASDDGQRGPLREVADVTVDAATFARLDPEVATVFLVENEINFLAFPLRRAAMVVWVAGFGTERLAAARWLDHRTLWYWGDLDTHGFAILDELRRRFHRVESFLMDRRTLLDHRHLWVSEGRQERRTLPRLTAEEADLYDDLRWDRLGERIRLEQERVGYRYLLAALDSMDPAVDRISGTGS
ncbi:MAG: Wadjet anti-phage system protein JetD domain-containing protein [Acidimicrobiales bacterium]